MDIPDAIGVLGAGQMGAGIAQMAAAAGARTLLYDPDPAARERGLARIADGLARLEAKGRLDGDVASVLARVEAVADIAALAPCGFAIEAAPERLELKLSLLGDVAAAVAAECVIATNTSSLSVTEIAAGIPGPERVVGLHFFNPAPVMRLAEVVAGEVSSPEAIAVARAVGEAMGKRVIDAADIAGFLVNRVNRPFFLESLRILQEGLATVEQIDRVMRMGGGFRMGPFELMDLIGIETNHAVAEGFLRQTYGEPRYRPSPLAARMVAAGRLGRKTGRGWYAYGEGSTCPVPDPPPLVPGGGDERVVAVIGDVPVLEELREAASAAGWEVVREASEAAFLTLCPVSEHDVSDVLDGPRALLLDDGSLHQVDPEAAGFHAIPPFASAQLVEVTSTVRTDPASAERLGELLRTLGKHVEVVGDGPGLVLGRVVAQLVNEAAFLIGEGNGSPEDVDAGMELGVNHPRGPVAWSDAIGLPHVLSILDGLCDELREERHRPAPLLRRQAAVGCSLSDL
jgi:3-hydroxybutyryl-CoA dehydrogenase